MQKISNRDAKYLVGIIDEYVACLEDEAKQIESRPDMQDYRYADDDRWCGIQAAIMDYNVVKETIEKQIP